MVILAPRCEFLSILLRLIRHHHKRLTKYIFSTDANIDIYDFIRLISSAECTGTMGTTGTTGTVGTTGTIGTKGNIGTVITLGT